MRIRSCKNTGRSTACRGVHKISASHAIFSLQPTSLRLSFVSNLSLTFRPSLLSLSSSSHKPYIHILFRAPSPRTQSTLSTYALRNSYDSDLEWQPEHNFIHMDDTGMFFDTLLNHSPFLLLSINIRSSSCSLYSSP